MKDGFDDPALAAGRLIQWALRVKATPFNEPEYRLLVDRYIDDVDFRQLVKNFADGLGLEILHQGDRGLFVGTQDGSVFAQSPSAFRGSRTTAEDRLLDGLIQLAIAATLYPRQQDLDENAVDAKQPVTVSEVDELLQTLSEEHRRRSTESPDVSSDELDQGLQEAWRVYDSRPNIKMTSSGNLSQNSTQSQIRKHLQLLVERGCFVMHQRDKVEMYRPTLRYQFQVRELAATKLYRQLQSFRTDDVDSGQETSQESVDA
tara:strand:- start:658918 stop:659697 length:780 start_codon:yes stop_codon:yes gene_type:complete